MSSRKHDSARARLIALACTLAAAGQRKTFTPKHLAELYERKEVGGAAPLRTVRRDLRKLDAVFGIDTAENGAVRLRSRFAPPVCYNLLSAWLDWLEKNHQSRDHVLEMMISASLLIIENRQVQCDQLIRQLREQYAKSVLREPRRALSALLDHPLIYSDILPVFEGEYDGLLELDASLNPLALQRLDFAKLEPVLHIESGKEIDADSAKVLRLAHTHVNTDARDRLHAMVEATRLGRPCRWNGSLVHIERLAWQPPSSWLLRIRHKSGSAQDVGFEFSK